MQMDMHFYGVGFLAMAAGLSKEDAFNIAYASQYVDDSVESEPLNCGSYHFDPVRTAHNGLGAMKSTVQRKIHQPFHFLPPSQITNEPSSFITVKNSDLSNRVIDRAISESDRDCKMIALGIAMHSYADTWAHSGFVGKEDNLNDVATLKYKVGDDLIDPILENIGLDAAPKIGHAQASHYPDLPWLEWEYTQDATGKVVFRKNEELFLEAAMHIHQRLGSLNEAEHRKFHWDEIKDDVRRTIAVEDERIEIRIRAWKQLIHDRLTQHGTLQRFTYNPFLWRNESFIFEGGPVGKSDWDRMTREHIMTTVFTPVEDFQNTRWVKFHRMARRQRNFVIEELY